jgi:hypothetical protein
MDMKAIKLIVITAIVCGNICACSAQSSKNVRNKEFLTFLSKFKTIEPPVNYKKVPGDIPLMTKKEAIQFLHKKETDLYYMAMDYGLETENVFYTKTENIPGCDFKYELNDSIYILCAREGILGGEIDTTLVVLHSFTLEGKIIDKCIVGEKFTFDSDWISFILLDKNTIRIYHYERNNTREDEGFLSSAYYVEHRITDKGIFIKNNKSDITYLKQLPGMYENYKPKSDDPMNEYNF